MFDPRPPRGSVAARRERTGTAVLWTFLPLPARARRRAAIRDPFSLSPFKRGADPCQMRRPSHHDAALKTGAGTKRGFDSRRLHFRLNHAALRAGRLKLSVGRPCSFAASPRERIHRPLQFAHVVPLDRGRRKDAAKRHVSGTGPANPDCQGVRVSTAVQVVGLNGQLTSPTRLMLPATASKVNAYLQS